MKIALAYSMSDNLIADNLAEALAYDKWTIETFYCTKDAKSSEGLASALANFDGPIVLLISDFFLRQTNCLKGLLPFFVENQNQVLPVLLPMADGSPLNLERIGDIIKYINYWQDKYLSFRNQRREMNLEGDVAFEEHLETVRNISKEIGEFLRYFRDAGFPDLGTFKENSFKMFFNFLEAPEEWEAFKLFKGLAPIPVSDLEVAEDAAEEESEIEKIELEGNLADELADIPGISLLPDDVPVEEPIEEPNPPTEAELLLSKIEAAPNNASYCFNYAVYLQEKKHDFSEAKVYFDQTLTINPSHPYAWLHLAKIYLEDGASELALAAYKNAISNNKDVKTKDNNTLFGFKEAAIQMNEKDENENPYDVALNALKSNIDKLSALIKVKNDENERLEQERLKSLEKEKVGKGKLALITGATSGIGKATATLFAKNGFDLILTGRRAERLEDFSGELSSEYQVDVKILVFDVTNRAATQKSLKGLRGKWRKIDVLINNAGKAKGLAPIHEGKIEHWEEMIDTNIKGLLYVTRMVSPWMVARRSGMIINLCSSAGKEVYPNGNVYCATKFAVDALTKGMRLDLHAHNIRVGQISPGHVEETEFAQVRFDGNKEKAKIYEKFLPLTSGDVADSIFYMATRPPHVNIEDVVLFGTQQASNLICDKSGRGEK